MSKRRSRLLRWLTSLSYRQIILLGLALGMLLSAATFYYVLRQEQEHAVANFHLDAHATADTLQQSLHYGEHDFAAARSLYRASSEVTRREFAEFITDQLESNPLPGLMALEWIPYVPADQRAYYEQIAQNDGLGNFHFTERDSESRLIRAGERDEYYPVYYTVSQTGQEYILGFDLGSDATRLATLRQARDTGRPAVSGPVALVQSPSGAKGSLIFLPVYENGAEVTTVADRRLHLRGFLLGVFDLHTLLTVSHDPQSVAAHDLYLVDNSQPSGQQVIFLRPGNPALTAGASPPTHTPATDVDQLRTDIHHEEEVHIGDKTWQLIIVPPPGEIAGELTPLPVVSSLAVLAFSALATAYIARRRQMRDILRKNEAQYRLVVDNVSDVIWAADAVSSKLEFITPSVLGLTGFAAEETLQRQYNQLLAPESTVRAQVVIPQRIAAVAMGFTGPYVDELALLRSDGSIVWAETTSHFAVDLQTQQVRMYGVSRDITERRRVQRTQAAQFAVNRILAQSPQLEDALVQVLESLTVGLDWLGAEFWQRTQDGSHLEWCAGWCKPDQLNVAQFLQQSTPYTFVAGQGLIGRTWQDNQAHWEADLDERPEYPRHAIGKAAGLKSAVSLPVCIDDDVLGVMVFHDASTRPVDDWLLAALTDLGRQIGQFIARKQAEIDLRNERSSLARRVQERTADLSMANAQLAHALSAKDEFLANMSHELRTPLNGIMMLAESLNEGTYGSLNSRQQRSMIMVAQSGQHLLTLINDVLDLAKVEAGKLDVQMEDTPASAIARASLALVQEMASKKSIQLAFGCNDNEVILRADGRRLKQVLVNLLGNAIKFTPTGGHVNLTVTSNPNAREIEFAVQDDGIGIPPAEQAKLFQPFTQLDGSLARHYEGTGLGLALVRRLVELHSGRVRVESTGISGQGCRFVVSLPWEDTVLQPTNRQNESLGQPPAESQLEPARLLEQSSSPADAPAVAHKAKILVVDDNELNLLALEDYLTNAGYELSFANDGEQALLQAQAIQPDLILMDIQMPKMSGIEATKRLRADLLFVATPILALTALAMPGDRELCLEAGANDYISKPFSLKNLVKLINHWLEHAGETQKQHRSPPD